MGRPVAWLVWLWLALSLGAWAQALPTDCRQSLVVTTRDWQADRGQLRRFERESGAWRPVGKPISVVVGRRGLAWGQGLDLPTPRPPGPEKREGDGRAPAGIFELPRLFGSEAIAGLSMPYLRVRATTRAVDDPKSRFYNQIVDSDEVEVDWRSSEPMLIIDYKLGLEIAHNQNPARPGLGSCIFFHTWEAPTIATSGCTATDASNVEVVCRWLRNEAHPVLVQLPEPVYREVRVDWGLP